MYVRYKETSQTREVTVYDTEELYGERGSFRVLQFADGAVQGAMDVGHPERILFEYPRAIIHLMEFNDPSFEDVFIIGHGIGTLAGYLEEKRCKVAEIDQKIVELSREWFGYAQDNVRIGDGRRLLEKEPSQAYDYLIVDAFTEQGTPAHLSSREFFLTTRDKLGSGGAIIMNLMGKGVLDKRVQAIHTTIGEVYAYTQSFVLPAEGSRDMQNILLMGSDRPIGYQARHMAGFIETELMPGYVIRDNSFMVEKKYGACRG